MVVPKCCGENVVVIEIHRGVGKNVVLERHTSGFSLVEPKHVMLASGAVGQLMDAVEQLTYRRSVDRSLVSSALLGETELRIQIQLETGPTISLAVGPLLPFLDRRWVIRSDSSRAFWVQGYMVRDLEKAIVSLRRRNPFVHSMTRSGDSIRVSRGKEFVLVQPSPLVVASPLRKAPASQSQVEHFRQILEAIEIRKFVARAVVPSPLGMAIQVQSSAHTDWLWEIGECVAIPNQRLVLTSIGLGCVDAKALGVVADYLSQPETLHRKELFPVDGLSQIQITRDRSKWRMVRQAGEWLVGETKLPTERTQVITWLDRFRQMSTRTWVSANNSGVTLATVQLLYADGKEVRFHIQRHPFGLLARHEGTAPAQLLAPEASTLWSPSDIQFLSTQLWIHDVWSLNGVEVRKSGQRVVQLSRGDLHTDWIVQYPKGHAVIVPALERLRGVIAQLRALRYVMPSQVRPHTFHAPVRIELAFDPAPGILGPSIRRTVLIGADTPAGCHAQIPGRPEIFELDSPICSILRERLVEE